MNPSELQHVLERRAERAALAASAARRNMPSSLLMLALLLLVIALVALAWAWSDRSKAVATLDARIQQASMIKDRAARIASIRQAQKLVTDTRLNTPLANQGPLRLQQAATSDAFKTVLASQPAKDSVSTVEPGLALRRLQYNNVQHASIADVMAWIEKARQDIPGLEIERLNLRPGPSFWTFSITFMRYEKKEG